MPQLAAYRPTVTPATDIYVELDDWAAPSTDTDGTVWLCTDVTGWNGSPPVRSSGEDRPEDHGQFDGPNFYGARVITVTGTAYCETREIAMKAQDAITSVAAWDSGTLFPLVVTEPGRPQRQCFVRLDGPTKVSPVYGGLQFDWQLALRAPDPMRYMYVESSTTLSLPPPGGSDGLIIPFSLPSFVPWLTASNIDVTLTNEGTFPTRKIVAVFNGPVTNPSLTNASTGLTLAFNVTLGADETLVCDFKARTALLNGTDAREYALTTSASWWSLLPGASDVSLGGIGGPSSGASIRFMSAWL